MAFLAIAVILVAAHDIAATPRDSFSARATIAAIDGYRAHVSPHLRGVIQCRFTPTCSAYGRESVRKYGFLVGSFRAARRIARCGPWTPAGTVDNP
ncbi:MAG TPA: membrane protein insertion efficiency factor YidD [Thermoanaerobaculia bacterium]|nr:membrane protein insertion efficiency factor YidD [Thermoanaerobaculia bacterium]